MKPLFFYIAILFYGLFTVSSVAQQTKIFRGKMLFLSSGKKPAVGVEVSGNVPDVGYANLVYTASDGSYELRFPKAAIGKLVRLSIGNQDDKGKMLELVNTREVRRFRIPIIATDDHDIIVCEKGARDTVAQRYYKIIKSSSDLEIKKVKDELDSVLNQKQKDFNKISMLSDKIMKMRQRSDSVVMYREAFRLASINKDNATKRVLKYLALLDQGKLIQEAREVLNIEAAADDMGESISQFNSAIKELETRADASRSISDYEDATECYISILGHLEKMEADRFKMATYFVKIADVSFDSGNYTDALEYQERAVDILEKILDPGDLELAIVYNDIALIYHALGRYKAALAYHRKSVAIREVLLDAKHPDLATSYYNIGMTHQALGQYATALDYQQKSMRIQKKLLGSKHPELAATYSNIGLAYQALGQYATALEYHQKAMAIRRTATDYDNIGITYRSLGRYTTALNYQQKAIAIWETMLEAKHPDLAASYHNIGMTYCTLGWYAIALDYQQKAIAIWETINPRHPDLATAYHAIALTYHALELYETALEYHQKSTAIQQEILTPNHPDLAASYGNIGRTYHDLGRYGEALEYHYKSLGVREAILEAKHPDLATTYNAIALTYHALGRYTTALEYHRKSITIRKKKLGSGHSDLGIGYMDLAVTYTAIKNFQKAIAFRKKGLTILKDVLPQDHPYRQEALPTLAKLYHAKGLDAYHNKDHTRAIKDYQKALAIPNDIEDLQGNLGLAYVKNKQSKEAYTAFLAYEKRCPNKGETYRNWAVYYAMQHEKEKALKSLQKAIDLGYNDIAWLRAEDGMQNLKNEEEFIKILRKLEKEQYR